MALDRLSIYIGFDPREAAAFAVAGKSIRRRLCLPIPIFGLVLSNLRERGLFTRPMSRRDRDDHSKVVGPHEGILWDDISGAPCATEFSITRFLTPHLAESGWALFMDCDMLARTNVEELFFQCMKSPDKAIFVVKHNHQPPEGVKMDGQLQTRYARKNWSSVMMFNCDHESNKKLTLEMVNGVPGRDLHRFCWLEDHEIGEIDQSWNYLVGHTSKEINPDIVHFTEGIPLMDGYEDCDFADEFMAELELWARPG